MIHPDTKIGFANEKIGLGVFATRIIPKGTVVAVQDPLDIVIDANSPLLRNPLYRSLLDSHAYCGSGQSAGKRIVCWDHSIYINHHCMPSCLVTDSMMSIARKDIQAGEELTEDYRFYLRSGETMICSCGAENCRGILSNDGVLDEKEVESKNRKLKKLRYFFHSTHQPLMSMFSEQELKDVEKYWGCCEP